MSQRVTKSTLRALRSLAHSMAVALGIFMWCIIGFEVAVRCGSIAPSELDAFPGSLAIADRDGQLLREVVGKRGMRAKWQHLDGISPLAQAATIAVEDARFLGHDGIDGVGVARAIFDNVRSNRVVSGASTITMQLARLLRPSPKTLRGKLVEMIRARRLERALAKTAILEHYLNRAPYGAGAIGIEAASQRYFAKPSIHLSLAEAALLAGLPKAPSRLDPLRFPHRAKARQRHVLARMVATGAIDEAARARAEAERLIYRKRAAPLVAMHFTDMVLHQLADGSGEPPSGRVETTLDHHLQLDVEGAVTDHVRSLSQAGLGNAAVVVLDNQRCEIRALVGSADYWAPEGGAVNGALARRQPGSTLKPFTYALAFENGDSPATVVADIDTRYGKSDGEVFRPKNFSGRFSGPVLMGAALGRSLNVPAIRVTNRVGVDDLLTRLRELGFASLDRDAAHYGLGLTLGNGEVTLLELTQAYAALARGGRTCAATALRSPGSKPGPADQAEDKTEPRAFSAAVSFLVTDILSDESLRLEAFGPGSSLLLDFPVAVKTGTSSNWRDSWAIGYTERFTVGVWSGNFDGSSMHHLAGAAGAGPLFHSIMSMTVERDIARAPTRPRPALPEAPEAVVKLQVCALSGHLPSPDCPHTRAVHVEAENRPEALCDWHQPIAVDTRNDLRAGPLCPRALTRSEVFTVLPPKYASWQAASGTAPPPPSYSPLCPADGPIPGAVVITQPRPGEVFVIEPGYDRATQTVRLAAEAHAGVGAVTWSIDGRAIARARWPYEADWPLEPGMHTISVSAKGQRGHEVAIEVR